MNESTHIQIDSAISDVLSELDSAMTRYPALHSAHEAYAVILEELDEVWDEVRLNPAKRDADRLRHELIQLAAMTIRAIVDLGM